MKKEDKILLFLREELYLELIGIAKNSFPNESVALLFGNIKKEELNSEKKIIYDVQKIDEFNKAEKSPVHFLINDYELLAEKWIMAQNSGLKLISIFHSHPSTAFISGTDKINMKQMDSTGYPGMIWVVYGNQAHDLKAFILIKGNFYQCAIKISKIT